mmetsp:Transcript_33816/g.47180  ORF Transcript_33816/g.47180 Transcript_33816/m.47180 type:complete len:98 (+) Transcript_33816:372-665(+)
MIINGRQINDSHVMVKNLAPILDGKELTDEMLEVEKLVTDGIQLSLSKSSINSCHDVCSCACLAGGLFGCFIGCISCQALKACCICSFHILRRFFLL